MRRKWKSHLLHRPFAKQILMLFLCAALLFPVIPAAAAETSANRTVKAGIFFFDGYHMQDSDGTYTGYGIELLNLISQYSHLNFEFTGYDRSWTETQSMLLNGEIDVTTSARKTKERTEVFAFSLPIELNSTMLTVQAQNTSIVSGNYSTYNGMMVGLLAGNSQNRFLPDFAEENGFTYRTREYDNSAQLEKALQDGAIDAILTSNLRRAENEKLLDTIKVDYFYAITRKDDQDLMDEINYAITQMNLYEEDWSNVLYNKYYRTDTSTTDSFTQRELEYIKTVASGEKKITVTSMPGQRPYSYAENGELKGIQPRFFDHLMQIAGLPYKMVVPEDNAEYSRLKENGDVDVVIDWQQSASMETEYISGGFLTDTYMSSGTTLITRKDFSGPVSSLAILDGLVGLPLEHEQFKNTPLEPCPNQNDVIQYVLERKTDAAFMRTHAAQFFINNDRTQSLQFSIIDSEQVVFKMYIPNSSDHELVTILNKCIKQVPDDVLSRLITEYTAIDPENMTFHRYMAAHPEIIFLLSMLAVLLIGAILFFYLHSRWNKKLFQTTEQSKHELEEQLAIVNALSRDYFTVYKLDMRAGTVQALKIHDYMPSGWDWRSGEAFPYTESLHQYIKERILDEDKDDLAERISLEQIKKALSVNPEYSVTFRIQLEEGIHSFQFVCVAYQAAGQSDTRVLLGFRNVDEIVRKEQKQKAALEDALHMVQAASEAKTAFFSNMSHDIRTPMNAIIGFLALMRNEVEHPEVVREYIQRIESASQHLLGLINDVLDMSKIESGSATLNVAEMNLARVITEINSIIQPQAKAKNQTFEIFASHLNFEHLMGDKMRINQILINLLSNSVKYTPEKGNIEMRVEELPQVVNNYSRIRFTVSDNGLGMSEEYLKVIFEPFTREDNKTTQEIQGTGLGMPITKSLVDLMGGTIKVDSKLGEGSTFVVELELRIHEQEDDPKFWTDHQITRIIVVDDEEEICRNVIKAMTAAGVSTDYATEGERAVQIVHAAQEEGKPYDLILLDWKMPGTNGLETARLIRKDSKIPILLLTSYDWREIEQEAVEIGVNHFMPKPFFMSTFKEAVRIMTGRAEEAKRPEADVVKGMHILVVDDVEVNQLILVKILTNLGAECDTAANGREAVEKFMDAPSGYDLILMDVQMPEMNGYEATMAIRASSHPSAKTVPIIALTANAFVDDVRDAINSGMDAHIAKPVQVGSLKSTIQKVLDNRAAAESL